VKFCDGRIAFLAKPLDAKRALQHGFRPVQKPLDHERNSP
jgi:hypothetical protein